MFYYLKSKNILRQIINFIINIYGTTKLGYFINDLIISNCMQRTKSISYNEINMEFVVPNRLNLLRIKTFATKEPETLDWIDQLPEGCNFWDIGANIGLYTVYASLKKKSKVVSFEPSVFNLELLARNIYLNQIHNDVILIPFALSEQKGSNLFRMTTTEWGAALSSFGKNVGWDGFAISETFAFPTYGLSIDQAVELLKLPIPDFIKMDVDGIEHFLLEGGESVLQKTQGILLEINDDYREQAELSNRLLKEAGLVLLAKRSSEQIKNSTSGFQNTYNQIWGRK